MRQISTSNTRTGSMATHRLNSAGNVEIAVLRAPFSDWPDLLLEWAGRLVSLYAVLEFAMARLHPRRSSQSLIDEDRMRGLYEFTARTLKTGRPVPFGALIVATKTGEPLMQATNRVMPENDPSSHAEVRTVRLACRKLQSASLAGYTLYSTCEPCPMCMANALWARLDRVVYGATIADANRFCFQIRISAREVARRSDMACKVDGPVLRDLCVTLFTHPNMQKAFRTWSSSKLRANGNSNHS
jgi:tRNA(Arg) A34 adenosine deaminase TadA